MAKTTGREKVAKLVSALRSWQAIERKGINDTAEIVEQTDNPLIRMVLEIIRHDSLMHHRIQQFLIDGLTQQGVAVSREELGTIWEKIEAHDRAERQTIELAKELRADLWDPIHRQLIDYLLADEEKHDRLLGGLNEVKTGMSKASGG